MIINQEKDVQYALADLDITYIRELSINKLHKRYHMTADNHLKAKRFDYYLPKLRTVIEFDDDQHFTPIDYFGGMDQFMSTVTTDFEKMNYCFDNNIKVIRLTQGTSSDFLAQAINDYKHNLITIKDNHLETQSVNRFDLPESFNIHIENQTLKSKMDHLTSHYESEIAQLHETITELQDELESLKNPHMDDSMIDSPMIDFTSYIAENYPQIIQAPHVPMQLIRAIYADYNNIPPASIDQLQGRRFYGKIKPYLGLINMTSHTKKVKFNQNQLLQIATGLTYDELLDKSSADLLPAHSNVLELINSRKNGLTFTCYLHTTN